jgi:hypothetical protein
MLTEINRLDQYVTLRDSGGAGIQVIGEPEPGGLEVELQSGQRIWIIAGQQMVAAEGVEILGLTLQQKIEDRQPAAHIVQQVLHAGAVPVLAWAPGKWMFRRSQVVRALTEQFGEQLMVGDSSLRPMGWPQPGIMQLAGARVLAGSDPLPFAGDEAQTGRYAVEVDVDLDLQHPVQSLRSILRDSSKPLLRIGKRNSPLEMVQRQLKHRQAKKVRRNV